jgi:uncharacterized protein with ParB-like and HNH nuclease domain
LNHYDTDDNDVALHIDFNSICDNPLYDTILNGEITEEELLDAIKNVKNNKSPGLDNILNEYLKNSTPELTRIYCKVFNIVLKTLELYQRTGLLV